MKTFDVVIVGAGHGGANAAIALRQQGFTGSVALVSEEAELPYERPPLSKDYLLGRRSFDKLLIRPPDFWKKNDIELILDTRIDSIDPAAHTIEDVAGKTIGYGKLVWATGGTARSLTCPGHDLAGVHTVRSRADIDRLISELGNASNVVVIGGGYIGLEAAAAISTRGDNLSVTVLESADRVLARVAAEPVARFYEGEHRAHGINIELNVAVSAIEGREGRVSGVHLGDGRTLPADIVIVGIGITPAVEPLIALGAAGDGGVEVDELCRTEIPDIYAIGDCTLHRHDFSNGTRVRLESVQNAVDQGIIAAKAITGNTTIIPRAVPRFWSDQFDLKLQTIGLSRDHDQVVVRGEPETRRFSVAYLRNGELIALDCINNPKDFVQGRNLIANRMKPDPAALEDPATPLAAPQART